MANIPKETEPPPQTSERRTFQHLSSGCREPPLHQQETQVSLEEVLEEGRRLMTRCPSVVAKQKLKSQLGLTESSVNSRKLEEYERKLALRAECSGYWKKIQAAVLPDSNGDEVGAEPPPLDGTPRGRINTWDCQRVSIPGKVGGTSVLDQPSKAGSGGRGSTFVKHADTVIRKMREAKMTGRSAQSSARWRVRESPGGTKVTPSDAANGRRSSSATSGTRSRKISHCWKNVQMEKISTVRFTETGQAKEMLRKAAVKVVNCLRWMKIMRSKHKSLENSLKSFLDIAQDVEDISEKQSIEAQTGLTFDVGYFRADRECKITTDVKHILTVPPSARTSAMVSKVVCGLQHVTSYSEYPLHMQEKLASVAWYQECDSKRMILKQGHYPQNFYFILAGQAQVKKVAKDDAGHADMQVMARLSSGQSFGELALIHGTRRNASVESVTDIKLLVISKCDFMDIFFDVTAENGPEHLVFLRHVEAMQDWPLDLLEENPNQCMTHYFRRGMVVVADSNQSEWIYIVKTGSCAVLKNLQAVRAKKTWQVRPSTRNGSSLAFVGHREPEARTYSGLPQIKRNSMCSEMREFLSSLETETIPDPVIQVTVTGEGELNDEHTTDDVNRASPLKETTPRPRTVKFEESVTTRLDPDIANGNEAAGRRASLLSTCSRLDRRESDVNAQSKSKFHYLPQIHAKSHTHMHKSVGFGNRGEVNTRDLVKSQSPCCVRLGILRPKDVFGLGEICFTDEEHGKESTHPVTLVSNGAELIMLSRDFFIRHSTEEVKRYIRETVRMYPSEETLQTNLQNHVNWGLYRQETVMDFMGFLEGRKRVPPIVV